MSKAKQQKESGNERFLRAVGTQQIGASAMFEGAHQAVLSEAGADHTNRFRGRQAGDVWQGLGPTLGSDNLARGDSSLQGTYERLATDALGSSLREGSKRGVELKDDLILEGAGGRLSNANASGNNLASTARMEDRVTANKIQIANDWNNQKLGALTTLASTAATYGYGQYTKGKKSAMGNTPLTNQQIQDADPLFKRGYSSGYNKWLGSLPASGGGY